MEVLALYSISNSDVMIIKAHSNLQVGLVIPGRDTLSKFQLHYFHSVTSLFLNNCFLTLTLDSSGSFFLVLHERPSIFSLNTWFTPGIPNCSTLALFPILLRPKSHTDSFMKIYLCPLQLGFMIISLGCGLHYRQNKLHGLPPSR